MSDRVTLRLPDITQDKLSVVHPGRLPGSINPDELRDALENYATLALQVKTGELTPEVAAGKMKSYFEALASAAPHAEQVYLSPEKKDEDEEAR